MKLIHRIGYYTGGLIIGIIILMFFLGGKRTSCDYGPESRVLKNITLKKRVFTEDAALFLVKNTLDTADVSLALKHGDVIFSESNTSLDSCKIYVIEYKNDTVGFKFDAQNCKTIATFSNFSRVD